MMFLRMSIKTNVNPCNVLFRKALEYGNVIMIE
jgi:hypothetical protein